MTEKERLVTIQQMKETLSSQLGSKFPVKFTRKDGEVLVRYLRGFADSDCNILLIAENPYNLALKVLEVKDIRTLEFAPEHSRETWKVLHAKWLKKSKKTFSVVWFLSF
jgi:hypothetical protein